MRRSVTSLVALGLLGLVVAHGVSLRLKDPLSTASLGAEDPYTHVVFTKEAVDKGAFGDSFHLGTSMYPPGLHAFLGILVPLSGVSYHAFARFVPVVFGAIAIVGTYLLAARLAGRRVARPDGTSGLAPHHAAGLAAALVTAILPEHVFRTVLLFPTALDLALLPAFLLVFVFSFEVARAEGRVLPRRPESWAVHGLLLLFAVPLAFAHPWVVPLFLAPAGLFAALRVLREERQPGRTAHALAVPTGIAALATAFAMASRWDKSDTGFSDFLGHVPGLGWVAGLDLPGPLVFGLLVVLLGAAAGALVAVVALATRVRARLPAPVRFGVAAGVLVLLLALLRPMTRDLPFEVSYQAMLGPAAILLALGGLAVALLRPSPLGDLGLGVSVLLFPMTALDLFGSPFWPQRTVAYLCVGVALLAGALVAFAHDLLQAGLTHLRGRSLDARERPIAGPVLLVCAFLLAAGPVAAAPAPTYAWYRMYDDAQFEAFREVVDRVEEHPESRVIVHGWQPGLLVKALGDPASVYYSPDFFAHGGDQKRAEVLSNVQGPAYVLVDKHLLREVKDGAMSISFLGGKKPVLQSSDGLLRLYCVEDCP